MQRTGNQHHSTAAPKTVRTTSSSTGARRTQSSASNRTQSSVSRHTGEVARTRTGGIARTNTGAQRTAKTDSSARNRARLEATKKQTDRRAERRKQPQSASAPGDFVDARKLRSENALEKTLRETSGRIGIATRPKVVNFKARQKEHRRAQTRVVLIRAGIAAAVVAVITALVWLLFFSPVFRLESNKITVNGANAWVSKQQIVTIANQQTGKSLLLVSDSAVVKELEAIPGVSDAKAQRQFPNGLAVSVTAERPAAMLQVADSKDLTAVDKQGRVLNSVAKDTSVAGIPVISVSDVHKALESRGIQESLVILDNLPESMRSEVTEVTANTQDSITTKFKSGITVLWGDSADAKLKIAIVDKVIHDPNIIGDKTQVDVSAPSRPIIK